MVEWLRSVCSSRSFYVGISKTGVNRATPNSPEYHGSVLNGGNVFHLETSAVPYTEYFWRVDVEVRSCEVNKRDVRFYYGDGIVTRQNGGSQWYSAAILIMMLAFLIQIMH